ncbi:MAG TPA: TetR/AcrR family transcriptional regulator [Calditrichaeota bacterium]|nr:TetR/AcrR family transcriptional regulator [Calditrichota bacterium]
MNKNNNTVWDEKKIRILNVSRQIFARFGFNKATMDDIARAMGMRKGSLYYYYKSKEDIIEDVILFESEQFLQGLQKEIARARTAKGKVQAFLQYRLERFKQAFNLQRISIQSFLEVGPMVHNLYKKSFEKEVSLLSSIIKEGILKGQFVQYPSKKIARNLLTLSDAFQFQEFQKNPTGTIAEIDYTAIKKEVKFITDIILNGISKKIEER